ncbi:MAG TPA: translation elongation factor Ts [bacterium]|nr:translation elongation factor Ts [bacterium]
MAEITAGAVKALREATGAGMMACKEALGQTNGDVKEATKLLREKGLADAAKRAGRTAAEGRIVFAKTADGRSALIMELNCETDFAAKNDAFGAAADSIAGKLLTGSFASQEAVEGTPTGDEVKALSAKIGEKVTLRRFAKIAAPADGLLVEYLHHNQKIGVLLAASGPETGREVLRQVAMHVAAIQPVCIDRAGVNPEAVAAEKEIARTQAKESGKPEKIWDKIIEGKLGKYYEQICLLEQAYVHDDKQKVGNVLKAAGLTVTGMQLFILGEGIEKKQVDLAKEVEKELSKYGS